MKTKVSVVLPIFNAERFLRQCLDSVVNQTLREIEIICVNDGSTDSSLTIIQEYAARDPRIVVIDKPNGGYGESMNRGLDAASGEYFGIVESDDFAEPDMFEKLYQTAAAHNLDVVKSGFYHYYSTPEEQNIPEQIASPVMARRVFCPTTGFPAKIEQVAFFNAKPAIWSAIYRLSFLRGNRIRFNETPGASYQDTSFNFAVWVCAKRVQLMEECFLHYRRDNEASSVNSPGKVYCICDEYAVMEQFLNRHPVERGMLEPVLVRIKYDSYMWNFERLAPRYQLEFLHRFRDEFLRHRTDGLIRDDYFELGKLENLKKILTDADRYYEYRLRKERGEEVPGFYDTPEQIRRRTRLKSAPRLQRYLLRGLYFYQDNGLWKTLKRAVKSLRRRLFK